MPGEDRDDRSRDRPSQAGRAPSPTPSSSLAAGDAVRRWSFSLFFLIPLVFVVIVSFWDYNEYAMLPAFTTRSYTETFEGCSTQLPDLCTILKTYLSTREVLLHRLAHRRSSSASRSPISSPSTSARTTMQIVLFARLHDPVLDLERHPHDLVDPAARPQRAGQPGADERSGLIDQPVEWLLYLANSPWCSRFVHLFTFFMVVPIFNSMMRIDKRADRGRL